MGMTNRDDLNYDETKLYPSSLNKLCLFLAAQGHKLLAIDAKNEKLQPKHDTNPVPQAKLDAHLASMSDDPNVKARIDILNRWLKNPRMAWRAKEIEKMEKEGDIHNRHYEEFLTDVEKLARNKYSAS